jgi:carbon-monoxide dehydrogenase medium subunit
MALPFIAHATVRNQGTVGGSVGHADPCGEIPNVVVLTGAVAVVAGPRGERTIAAADLFLGPMSTSIGADEVLIEVRFPAVTSRCGSAFVEVSRRTGDPALVAVGASLELDEQGLIATASIALSAVAPTPVRAEAAAAMLVGERPSADVFAAVAAAAAADVDPVTDLHATAAYRRHLTAVLVRRALAEAVSRAT